MDVILDNASDFAQGLNLDRRFPFDEDKGLGRRNEIRSHLDDLASRHPEFADHLLGPPWDIPFKGSPRNRRGQNQAEEDTRSQASGSSGVSSQSEPEAQNPSTTVYPQYAPRNTNTMENDLSSQRNQRSMSAPPENRQKAPSPGQRFVTTVEIPPQQQQQQPPQPQREKSPAPQPQSNVRHIPIFVEGRDEPVLPKNIDPESVPSFQRQQPSPPSYRRTKSPFGQSFGRAHQFTPQFQDPFFQRDRDQFDGPRWASHSPAHQMHPNQQTSRQPSEKPRGYHQPEQQPSQETPSQPSQPEPAAQAEKPKPPLAPKDPLEKVALVQQEVDSLTEQVKQFTGTSRQDKQYIYLDEMLTRELIKLDDIDHEGKENVRQARRNAINSIQKSISLLESKIPLSQQQTTESEILEEEQVKENLETMETADSQAQEQIQNAIPLPPCTSQALVEKESEKAPDVDLENRSDDQKAEEKVAPDTSMEVQVPAEAAIDEAAAAVQTETETENKQKTEDLAEESSQEQTKVEPALQIENDETTKETTTLKKGRKTKKKPTPISEQAIPLPAPEAKPTTI